MVATASDLAAGITPGSLEHGDRAPLEAGLAQGAAAAAPAPATAGVAPPVDNVGSPLAGLMDGSLNPGQSNELTDGLTVGAGPGPIGSEQVDPRRARLVAIAQSAQSPLLRAAALNELRSISNGAL